MKTKTDIVLLATNLLRSIVSADPNLIDNYNISDVILRDLYKQCKNLLSAMEELKRGWVVKMPSAQNLEGKEGMLEALSIAAQTTKTVSGWKSGEVELWDVVEIFDNEEDATAAGKVCENMTIYQIETGRLKWLD